MEPRIERLIAELRRTPLSMQLLPPGASHSWPIPLRSQGRVYVIVPFFGFRRAEAGRETQLFPPFATFTLDWQTGCPVEYVHLKFKNVWPEQRWMQPAGVFPHPAVAQLSPEQYRTKRTELLQMYDEMLDMLAKADAFPREWTERFSELLRLLMEPGLESYLRALGPKFFARFLPERERIAQAAGV